MVVTATEFKTNFGKYLELIAKEDIFITRNGKMVAKVVNLSRKKPRRFPKYSIKEGVLLYETDYFKRLSHKIRPIFLI